jgi:hypothetical protein
MSKFDPDRMSRNKTYMAEWERLREEFFRELIVPMRELTCPKHGVFEGYVAGSLTNSRPCPTCGKSAPMVEFSTPAKRNPDKGIMT